MLENKISNQVNELKKEIRKDNAWIRLLTEYDSAELLTKLLMVNRQLTKHEKRLLNALPELHWSTEAITNVEYRNVVLIRNQIKKFLEKRLRDYCIEPNSSKLDHITLGNSNTLSVFNAWHKTIKKDRLLISVIATIDVPKEYYISGFQQKEIILPSRCADVSVNTNIPYATVIVKIVGIANLGKQYIYKDGSIISAQEGYNEFLENYQNRPWYRRLGALVPKPFTEWICEQKIAKAPSIDPQDTLKEGIIVPEVLKHEANKIADEVSYEFSTLWTEILGHYQIKFRKPQIKLKNRKSAL